MAIAKNVNLSIKTGKAVLVDIALLAFVYYIPSLSHLFSIPLYLFEPMRIALFVSILLLHNRNNAYILAFTLPLFSYIVAGHPIAVKNMIMALELLTNVFILCRLLDKNVNPFISCSLSIIISKLLYYLLKYGAISIGMLTTSLIDTSLFVQLTITVVLALVFWFSYNVRKERVNG